MKNFKDLLIWQKGMDIWQSCYQLSKLLPSEEKFGLISQLNRAAASIPANIVEGSSRSSEKEYARFIQIALGSTFEVETFLLGINRLQLISTQDVDPLLALIEEEQRMLSGFLRKLSSD